MIDFKKITDYYKVGNSIQLSDFKDLLKKAKTNKFQRLDYLIKEGSLSDEIFVILEGLVRVFAINESGQEITIHLMNEYQVVVNTDTVMFNQASRFFYQALEPTTCLSLSYLKAESIINENPKLLQHRKFLSRNILKKSYTRIESFVFKSPEERYLAYIDEHPAINERVPDKYIAHVLGITPVTLSRIRHRIAQKNRKAAE